MKTETVEFSNSFDQDLEINSPQIKAKKNPALTKNLTIGSAIDYVGCSPLMDAEFMRFLDGV